jgi:hypothetical protein
MIYCCMFQWNFCVSSLTMATVPKQVEVSNRKGTQIVELCICWCYQSFNPKRDAMLLQFLRHFQAHALRVHKPRAAEFWTVTPDVHGPSEWNVLRDTVMASRILRWLVDFWKFVRSRSIPYRAVPDFNIGPSILHSPLQSKRHTCTYLKIHEIQRLE